MSKVRFGIIGCGMIANSHALSILDDERAELVAVSGSGSIGIGRAEAFAKKYNVPKVYSSYTELIKDKDIDVICICTPSGLHGEITIAAASGDKHVLCEKPLDIKSPIMTEMIRAAREHKIKLGCVFPNRTRSGLRKAKKLLESGRLGRMTIVECQYVGYRSKEYYASAGWRGTWALDGGGCLMNQGIHAIDTMCWLAGDVDSVIGDASTTLRNIEVEDNAAALLKFKNGAKGVIMGTTISNVPENAPEGDRIRIECELGTIMYVNGKTSLHSRIFSDDGKSSEVIKTELDDDEGGEVISSADKPENIDMESHSFIVKDMVSAILEDRDPYITGESARKCVDLVLAIYESSKYDKRVYINQ